MKSSRVLVGTYRLLGARSAEVFVASSRCPCVKIDELFYLKPYPTAGGRSMPRVFDCLKPYFKKWKSATTFYPVQGDSFSAQCPRPTMEMSYGSRLAACADAGVIQAVPWVLNRVISGRKASDRLRAKAGGMGGSMQKTRFLGVLSALEAHDLELNERQRRLTTT